MATDIDKTAIRGTCWVNTCRLAGLRDANGNDFPPCGGKEKSPSEGGCSFKHVSNLTPLQQALSKASFEKRAQVISEKEQRRNDPTGVGPPNLERWCKVCGNTGHSPSGCPANKFKDEWCDRCKCKGHVMAECHTPDKSLARCIKSGNQRRQSEADKASGAWCPGNGGGKGGPTGSQGKNFNQRVPDIAAGANVFPNFTTKGGSEISPSAAALAAGMTDFLGPIIQNQFPAFKQPQK